MNGSVKENILNNCRFDRGFYDRAVQACARLEDFTLLPDGDEKHISCWSPQIDIGACSCCEQLAVLIIFA